MKTNYWFKFQKGTLGISIDLQAEDIQYSPFDNEIEITGQIVLQIDVLFNVSDIEKAFLVKALTRLSDEIQERLSGRKIAIRITRIDFDDTDYQPEGLYVAMLGWISKRYDVTMPHVPVEFNKERKKYSFDIP